LFEKNVIYYPQSFVCRQNSVSVGFVSLNIIQKRIFVQKFQNIFVSSFLPKCDVLSYLQTYFVEKFQLNLFCLAKHWYIIHKLIFVEKIQNMYILF
jgi:hypothetical protein